MSTLDLRRKCRMEKKIAKDRKKQIFSVWPRAIKLKANEL